MSIVCATDFSEGSRSAATVAALLAARRQLPLWLVHRASPDSLRAAAGPVREGLEALLREECARLRHLTEDVRTELVEGPLDQALADFTARRAAHLLVVGVPGEKTPFGGAGGSLDRLAQASVLPLLRVRDPEPFRAWTTGERPLRVMFAVDRSRGTEAARAWLQQLQAFGPLELVAGHVFYAFDEARRLGLPLPRAFDDVSPALHEALVREVRDLAGPAPGSREPVTVRLQAGVGRMADDVVRMAETEGVDLVVVGSHPHNLLSNLWSVAHHTLRLAPMAVAAVPSRANASVGQAPLPTIDRLLVSTDLSELGDAAIPFAFALAPPNTELHLVTVVEPGPTPEERRATERLLRQRVPHGAEQRGVTVHVEVLTGESVAQALTQAAERLNVDLLCMGSRGRGGLGRALLGSVTQQVLTHSRRPVLVLRPPAR
jgi:nucleotide-binding universal stress UspA family protein